MSAHAGPGEPAVDWALAGRVAREVARTGDRAPTDEERRRLGDALALAELWLDATDLPPAPDAGRAVVLDRAAWVTDALAALPRLVEPIARAAGDALVALATEQFGALDELLGAEGGIDVEGLARLLGASDASGPGFGGLDLGAFDPSAFGLGPDDAARMKDELARFLASAASDPSMLAPMLESALAALRGGDADQLLRPAARLLAGLQVGQVVGRLAGQVLGHHDLGVATGPRGTAALVAVNVDEAFAGYGLDATEVALVVATTGAAHRRLHHAIAWLDGHVAALVGAFAAASTFGVEDLRSLADELAAGLDLEDPDVLGAAMERAASLRLEPNAAQRRVLERLQAIVGLVGAWARAEARAAMAGRLPDLARIEEVLRRRRATAGDGEELLAGLLGLDLRPPDEAVAERFVATVRDALGASGLAAALAHPETLPAPDELAEPARWLVRVAAEGAGVGVGADAGVPDSPAGLDDAGLGTAPHEPSADERRRGPRGADRGNDEGGDVDAGGDGDTSA